MHHAGGSRERDQGVARAGTAQLTPRNTRGSLVGLTAASVGVIYGYDLSCIAGALLFLTDDFGLTDSQKQLLTTMVVIGQIAGALSGGVLANAIGRKRSMVVIVAGYAVLALLGAASVSLPMLMVARLLLGLTIGVSVVVVPVYVAESAPAATRGALLSAYQLATVSGVILGYLSGYLLAGTHSWRLILGLAAVPATLLLPLLLRAPDTARWYLMRGRVAEARQTLQRVEPDSDVDGEVAEITRALGEERGSLKDLLCEMLRTPFARATAFVVSLGFLMQITGINAIIYYSPSLFGEMGFRDNFGLLALPALVQVGGLAATGTSLALVDRVGRRPLLLCGIALMIAADGVLMVVYARGFGAADTAFGFAGVLLFTVGFDLGFGALVWVYAGESFPSRLRSMGSSAMLTANLVGNVIVAACFLTLQHSLGGTGSFAVFAVFGVASLAVMYRFAPETKGRQLEEIRHFWENGGRWH